MKKTNKRPRLKKYTVGGTQPDKNTQQLNSTVDMGISQVPVYGQLYGAMNQGQQMGKGMIGRDANGMPTTAEGRAEDRLLTPIHSQVVSDASHGDYGQVAANVLTGGVYGSLARPFVDYNKTQVYAMGGLNNKPNAEVEGDEIINTNTAPQVFDGGFVEQVSNNPYGVPSYKVHGRSHENNGVKVGLEQGAIMNGKTINPITGKLFRDDIDKITKSESKMENIKKDANSQSTSKNSADLALMLKAKQKDALNKLQQDIIEKKRVDSLNRHYKKYGKGGVKKYYNGGEKPPYETGQEPWQPTYDNGMETLPMIPSSQLAPVTDRYYGQMDNFSMKNTPKLSQDTQYPETMNPIPIDYQTSSGNKKSFDWNTAGDISSGVMQNVGNAWALKQSNFGKNYDRVNYGEVKPMLPNFDQARKSMKEAYYQNKKDINSVSGGNAALTIANFGIARRGYSKQVADAEEQFQNAITTPVNQSKYANQGYKIEGMKDEAANKATSENIAQKAISSISQNQGSAYRDYKAGSQDNKTLAMISVMYPEYQYKNGKWIHKTRGTDLNNDIKTGNA